MKLSSLPSISFADTDTDTISASIVKVYEGLAGRTLAKGDPVRLFLLSLAAIIVQQRVVIDTSAKNNLLAYASGDYLDHIGVLVGVDRISAAPATTTLQVTLSAARDQATIIPAGTRATAGNGVYFAIDSNTIIPAGTMTITAPATCTDTGAAGNGYRAGEICNIVDPIAFVSAISNTTESEGECDIESDDDYRERIQEAPERYSSAGPSGAYEYHTKQSSALITDVSVESPAPGEVVVRPLLSGGVIPGTEILATVSEKLNDKTIRPLTDKVTVTAPEAVTYNVTMSYWIDRDDQTNAPAIQNAVESAVKSYTSWQKEKLGRDINPTELYYLIRAAGAKRAEITEPKETVVGKSQVAIANAINVTFGGLEDG